MIGDLHCHTQISDGSLSVSETVKEEGGLAVLAHPGNYGNFELVEELSGAGLDGIEVWHPKHSRALVDMAASYAKMYNLIMTGGSDFHGMYDEDTNPLGSFVTPETEIVTMFERKNKSIIETPAV